MASSASKLLFGLLTGVLLGAGGVAATLRLEMFEFRDRLTQLENRMNAIDPRNSPSSKSMIYADFFSGSGGGWKIKTTGEVIRLIRNGKYSWDTTRRKDNRLSLDWRALPSPLGDFTVKLRLQWVEPNNIAQCGLALGWDQDNFVLLGMTTDNYSITQVLKGGEWLEEPLQRKNIRGVSKEDFVIEVSVQDKELTFYLDDEAVGRFSLKEFDVRRIGMYVSKGQRVEFDSLVVESGV